MSVAALFVLERPLFGLDLETTGTNPETDRICEIGLEINLPGEPMRDYRTLVNPLRPIPAGATRRHKITDEMVQAAPTFAQLAPNLLKGLCQCDYGGYNVRFDLRLLSHEFKRTGHAWAYEDARVLDGLRLWQVNQARSLEDAIREFCPEGPIKVEGERGDEAHNALWDVKNSMAVIRQQILRWNLPLDLKALHDMCAPGWFDADGKLQWRDGELVFSFGQHRNKSLQWVVENDRGYITRFILKKDFTDTVKEACRRAIYDGVFPEPPASAAEAGEEVDDECSVDRSAESRS